MTKSKIKAGKHRSRLSAAIHETAAGLHRIGLMDNETMQEFNASCLSLDRPENRRAGKGAKRRAHADTQTKQS